MKRRIIIAEEKITRAGQVKLFQIPLPKNTKKIVAIGTDLRIETEILFAAAGGSGEAGEGGGSFEEVQWDVMMNPLAGRLVMQSMEKANIFFYDQVWAVQFNDGISNLDGVDSMSAFACLKKKGTKSVEVPCDTTIINCLYRDSLGAWFEGDVTYFIKVLLWIECEEEDCKTQIAKK